MEITKKAISHIGILFGSYRHSCSGWRVVQYISTLLKAHGAQTHIVSAREEKLPMLTKTYQEYVQEGSVPENLKKIHTLYEKMDGFVIVSGEYNHVPQPGLLNLLDFFLEPYHHKPSGLVTYSTGAQGGIRCLPTLRAITGALGMAAIPTTLMIGSVRGTLSETGSDLDGRLSKRGEAFAQELLWYTSALKKARAS